MGEITGALIGISLVLSAVFIPMAFFGGSTGVIYRQFSITIVSSMVLSVLMALSLTPALCASLLRPHAAAGLDDAAAPAHGPAQGVVGRFFAGFNRAFQRFTDRYQHFMRRTLGRTGRMMLIYGVIVAALGVSFVRLPTSFLPDEDQGLLMAMVQLPASASAERTRAVLAQVEDYLKTQPEVNSSISLIGMGGDQASGNLFVRLKDWSLRKGRGQDAASLAARFSKDLSGIRDARIFFMMPPAVRGLGSSAGFTVELEDLAGLGHEAMLAARDQFVAEARKSPLLTQVRPSGLDDAAQLQITVDDSKAAALDLSTSDVNSTLSVALGGSYVNDFINKSRVKKVYMQGDAPYRMQPDDLKHWYVRNGAGEMVPFSAFATASWAAGPAKLERYSGMSSFEIVGSPAPGVSTGAAMAEVEKIVAKLPTGVTYEWAGQSYQERLSGSQAPALYALSILFVFLCLAALYESWSVPFSVMLVVPLGVIGAVLATWLAGLSNDVYFQIGLLTTVGLSAKNAILIVEFAQKLYDEGMDLLEATLQALKLRLRPIVMTSLAFGFGVLPLAIATGAASASRRAIGTGVLGGMVTATVLGLVFIPVFYLVVRRFFQGRKAVHPTPSLSENAA